MLGACIMPGLWAIGESLAMQPELCLDHYTGPPVLGESHRLLEISFGHDTISALVKPSPVGS